MPIGLLPRGPVTVRAAVRTDVGLVRKNNEDTPFFADLASGRDNPTQVDRVSSAGLLAGVCDGMGGAAAGEVASNIAAREIPAALARVTCDATPDEFATALVNAIVDAGEVIRTHAKAHPDCKGMGTTCTAVACRHKTLFVGQIGDSRAYVFRLGKLVQVTKDQTLLSRLIEEGAVPAEDSSQASGSNVVLQALGSTENIRVAVTTVHLRRGDRLLVCSDGLSGLVSDDAISRVLSSHADPGAASDKLIMLANDAGGGDNITVVVCEFDGDGLPAPSHEEPLRYCPYVYERNGSSSHALGEDQRPVRLPLASYRSHTLLAAVVLLLAISGIAYQVQRAGSQTAPPVRQQAKAVAASKPQVLLPPKEHRPPVAPAQDAAAALPMTAATSSLPEASSTQRAPASVGRRPPPKPNTVSIEKVEEKSWGAPARIDPFR